MSFALNRAYSVTKMQPSTPRTPPPPTGAGYRPALAPPGCPGSMLGVSAMFAHQVAHRPGITAFAATAASSNNGAVLDRDIDLAPAMVVLGQAQLHSWLGVHAVDTYQESWPLRDSKAHLCLVGTSITVKQRRHAVICVVLRERPGSSNSSGGSLTGSVLHWGCVKQERGQWQPPPPGWHTLPDASHDAGGGAWQTPFEEHVLGEGGEKVQVMLLQIPMEGPLSHGGIASIVKASGNRWLGNGRTRNDFYFDLQRLPHLPLGDGSAASSDKPQEAGLPVLDELGSNMLNRLDLRSLGEAPPAPQPQHKHKQHAKEPELPNAGRRAPEPKNDDTQVCSLSTAVLRQAAEARLRTWASVEGHEVSGITHFEFAVKGHSAPFVVAATAVSVSNGEAQLLLCGVADQGFTGTKVTGLVLQWSCAPDVKGPPVDVLPGGWATMPSYSWDAGDNFWATPFSHTSDTTTEEPKTYNIGLRIPLTGAFRTGGLLFELKTARGQWLRDSTTGGHFFLSHRPLAEAVLGPLTPEASDLQASMPADPATPTTPVANQHAASSEEHKAVQDVHASCSDASIGSHGSDTIAATQLAAEQTAAGSSSGDDTTRHEHASSADGNAASAVEPGQSTSSALQTQLVTYISAVSAPVCEWMVKRLAEVEHKAERSLMHRFQLGAELLGNAEASDTPTEALTALAVWLRYSAGRQLTWNRNYNVKPREISAAQDAFASKLATVAERVPERRHLALLAMAAVGRGGQLDVGQRIRDEILTIQHKNNCKGGMMEEWHQKLHNNTSPDDVVICEALLAYIRSGLAISAYWDTLAIHGIDAARLASYDRPVRSEPRFSQEQCAGLERDLVHYLATLRAVHCGDDLRSAADTVLGYKQHAVKGKAIDVPAVPGVASPKLRQLVNRLLQLQQPASQPSAELDSTKLQEGPADGVHTQQQEDKEQQQQQRLEVEDMPTDAAGIALLSLQLAAEARQLLQPHIVPTRSTCGDRLKDVLFLDMALGLAARTALQTGMEALRASAALAPLKSLLSVVLPALQHACLSGPPPLGGTGDELELCVRQLQRLAKDDSQRDEQQAAMEAQAVWDRLSRVLGDAAEQSVEGLQPVAQAVAAALGIKGAAVELFAEEVVRNTSAAALAQLLSAFEPRLRQLSGAGPWLIISRQPASVTGQLLRIASLADVQRTTYEQPTILVTDAMGGDEDLPSGAVGLVVLGSCPDVLCHAAVRARNARVPFVACLDADTAASLTHLEGKLVQLTISSGDDVTVAVAHAGQQASASSSSDGSGTTSATPAAALAEPQPWCGRWVVPASDFAGGVVGAKSLNTVALSGRLPAWVRQPWSMALPLGVFEAALKAPGNESVQQEVQQLLSGCGMSEAPSAAALQSIREAVMQLSPPPELQQQLAAAISAAAPSNPLLDFEPAWAAIKQVWASQWNDRAALALARAGLAPAHLRMGVLVQGVLGVQYAFVAHTHNPTNGDASQVYVDIVRGLGEVLVGGWPGRALSAVVDKRSLPLDTTGGANAGQTPEPPVDLDAAVTVVGYASKSVALVLPAEAQAREDGVSCALMMRSDSNAEDLPGFAGAGLFDSHPTMQLQRQLVDYSAEPLVAQPTFAQGMAWRIALACCHVEALLGCAQDVEGGVCADGSIVILQARPQV